MIVRIRAKVQSRARDNSITRERDGSWKVRVTAAPAGDKANEQVIELVAREFDVPKTNITIVRGGHAKEKVIDIFLK